MKKTLNKGMTLVEILVVLVLISVLSGLVGIRITGSLSNVRGSASLLQTHLWFVKQKAITTRQRIGLVFDGNQRLYAGVAVTTDDDQINPFNADPLEAQLKVSELATNLESNTIYFDSRGRPVRANGQPYETARTITLRSNGESTTVVIEAGTGYIHL